MRALDSTLIREVWDGLCAYAPEQSETEARAFVSRQPHREGSIPSLSRERVTRAYEAAVAMLGEALEDR